MIFEVATVLTVHGIETSCMTINYSNIVSVATVLTVHGIETALEKAPSTLKPFTELQQCLPFTVLKLHIVFYACYGYL